MLEHFLHEVVTIQVDQNGFERLRSEKLVDADCADQLILAIAWVKLRSSVGKEPLEELATGLVQAQSHDVRRQEM